MSNEQLVSKVWNCAHVLRDQGISHGDHVEQITFLLFLKMVQERVGLLGEVSSKASKISKASPNRTFWRRKSSINSKLRWNTFMG